MTHPLVRALLLRLGLVVFVHLVVASDIVAMTMPARSVTGTNGPATVTVTPTSQLDDGQVIDIHVDLSGGTQLFEIRAHVCAPGMALRLFPGDTYDFGYEGQYCSLVAPGQGDAETAMTPPQGATSGDLQFKAGVGTVTWTDADPQVGAQHSFTCGPGSPCDLVVQLQTSAGLARYFAASLCFGPSCPPESDPSTAAPGAAAAPPAAPPAAASNAASSSSSVPSSAPPAASGSTVGGATSGSAPATAKPDRGSEATSSVADADPASSATIVPTLTDTERQAIHVFSAGATGLLGGALIAWIIVRGRRRLVAANATEL